MVEFNCTSTRLVQQSVTRLKRSTLLLNSKAPEQNDDGRVLALAPQVEPTSFINKLFRFFSLPAVFVTCFLYSVRSTVTPR